MPSTEKHFESSLCYDEESQGLIAGPNIDVPQLKKMLAQGGITLLDVRRRADRETSPGMIPGAIWRDPEQVEQWAGEVEKNARTVIYCAHGKTPRPEAIGTRASEQTTHAPGGNP